MTVPLSIVPELKIKKKINRFYLVYAGNKSL